MYVHIKYCFFVGGGATCEIDATLDKVIPTFLHVGDNIIPYSRKYWRSLNLAVWPKTTFLTPLLELNLAVWYGIAICTCTHKKFGRF